MFSHNGEDLLQVAQVCKRLCTFHQHVVNVDLHVPSYLLGKHLVHQMLVGRIGVLEAKWHELVAVKSAVCGEGSLLLVWSLHANLVIAKVGVHEIEEGMHSRGIYQLVDL